MEIHEGCTAIVTNGIVSENIGKITTVGKYIGSLKKMGWGESDYWEVETQMINNKGELNHVQREKNLMKLYDEDTKIEKKEAIHEKG